MKKNGLRTSTSFYDSLDKAVEALLEAAVKRAKANKRQTVMAQDV
jgi:histone H3/H4